MGSIENEKGCADRLVSAHPLLIVSVALGFFVLTIIKKSNVSAAIQRGSLKPSECPFGSKRRERIETIVLAAFVPHKVVAQLHLAAKAQVDALHAA